MCFKGHSTTVIGIAIHIIFQNGEQPSVKILNKIYHLHSILHSWEIECMLKL